MPVQFKGLSEYDRNYTWKNSESSQKGPTQDPRWAGLRSDELGITREPGFPSKRRVPYYRPQISKSFQWKEHRENGYIKEDYENEDPVKLRLDFGKESAVEEKLHTPDAPRFEEKLLSKPPNPSAQLPKSGSVMKKVNSVADNNKETEKANTQADDSGIQRVLKKKAGLNTVTIQHPLKMSEYRRQFERKTPTDNSPMLAAEKVIYNKNKLVPPFNINALKTETEYNSQFKGSPPAKGPKLRKDWEEKTIFEYEPEDFSHKRKDKKKKSNKPVSGLSNKDSPEAEIKQISQKRKHKEKVLQLLKHSYKSSRRIKSEYSENYLSPSAYQYRDGAWIRTKKQNDDQDSNVTLGALWVAEVKELREKAEYYRRRERGTHFSRDHLNQILSENNRLWDVSSNSSSEEQVSNNIKALDLAGFQASNNVKFPPPSGNVNAYSDTGNLGISDVPTLPVQRKLVWGENDVSEPAKVRSLKVEEKKTHASESEVIEVEEQMEQIKEHADSQQVKRQERLDKAGLDPLENDLEHTSEEGRLPTPKLKEFGLSLRTHHDRTTPSTGGALLVSPMKEQLPTPENSKKGSSERSTPFNKDAIKEYLKKQSKKETTSTSPHVAGIRTVDPIPLREDPWPNARNASNPSPPSFTTAVTTLSGQKPVVSLSQHWSPSCRIQGNLRHPEFQHNGSFGSTGYYSKLYSDDCSTEDDRLSQISERSVASSSLASQVLERAQRRKEHFWGKK